MGTFAWAAPEVLLGRPCTEKVDVYSYGVMLWELSAGEAPTGRHLRPLRCARKPSKILNTLEATGGCVLLRRHAVGAGRGRGATGRHLRPLRCARKPYIPKKP